MGGVVPDICNGVSNSVVADTSLWQAVGDLTMARILSKTALE